MFLLLVSLFTIIPAIEIYLLFTIGAELGAMNTILVILVTGVVGAALAKSQGLLILHNIQKQLNSGQLPANEIIHGFLVFGGGLLLLTPGFLTDILGFSAVIPGTRHLIAVWLKRFMTNAIASGNMQFTSFGQTSGGFHFYSNQSNLYEEESLENPNTHLNQNSDNTIDAKFTTKE